MCHGEWPVLRPSVGGAVEAARECPQIDEIDDLPVSPKKLVSDTLDLPHYKYFLTFYLFHANLKKPRKNRASKKNHEAEKNMLLCLG